MTADHQAKGKFLIVSLPEAEKRNIKSLAAQEGLTLRQAIIQAFQAWEAQLQSRDRKRRAESTGDAAGEKAFRPARSSVHRVLPEATARSPSRSATAYQRAVRAAAAAATAAEDAQAPQRSGAGAWVSRAARLDWSKCPLVESVPAEGGGIWVLKGTDIPLDSVLMAVDEGHPLLKISKAYKLSVQFLLAVLQYVAKPAKPRNAG